MSLHPGLLALPPLGPAVLEPHLRTEGTNQLAVFVVLLLLHPSGLKLVLSL